MGVTLLAPYRHVAGGVTFNRLYLPSTGAAAVSPAFDAAWAGTAGADRIKCVTTRISSAMTNAARTNTATANALVRQYVSDPIAAQTIAGTVKGRARAMEDLNSTNAFTALGIRVVSNDGSTVRGTLLAVSQTGSTEFALVLTNRVLANAVSLSSVVAEAGDRLVIEIGAVQNSTGTRVVTFSFGDDSGTDLPEDSTTTTANNPWLEFSQAVTLAA